jgi:uncharacterized protein (TIGR03067 family)
MIIIKDDQLAFRYYLPRKKEYEDLIHCFRLDSATAPKRLELSKEDGSVHVGIYEFDEENLKISWSRSNLTNPPADFTCVKGSNRRLFVLKRRLPPMNKKHILWHLRAAHEKLTRSISSFESDEPLDEGTLYDTMRLVYNYLNPAWNGRHLGDEGTSALQDHEFHALRRFPSDIVL